MKIELSLDESLELNAARYFEKAKKAKKKLRGAIQALQRSKEKLESFQEEEERLVEKTLPKPKKEWYEKFKWFVSSEGFLVVSGKDARTNELIVKKHAQPTDLVIHTDMAGSPFTVVKGGAEASLTTLREAAGFTFAHSKAWRNGFSTTPIFYVKPEQVTKQAPPGTFLPTGAFIIRGRTNYVEPETSFGIGVTREGVGHNAAGKVMFAPLPAVKKNCSKYVELAEGASKHSETAKKVSEELGVVVDEVLRVLPPRLVIKTFK